MNFTYSENSKTNTNTNINDNKNIMLTKNEINIINKYKIENYTKFNKYMDTLLPEIKYTHINNIKTDIEGNEFKIKINNEEIFFSNNTFYIEYNGDKKKYDNFTYKYHINKKNINIDDIEDDYERNITFYKSFYVSNIYKNILIHKLSNTISINFSYIFNLLKLTLPLLKIIYTENFCYLIYNKPNYIIDINHYSKKNINNDFFMLTRKTNIILNNNNYYNRILKILSIFKKLNIDLEMDLINLHYSNDSIFINKCLNDYISFNSDNKNIYFIDTEVIKLIIKEEYNEYITNSYY